MADLTHKNDFNQRNRTSTIHGLAASMPTADSSFTTFLLNLPSIPCKEVSSISVEYHQFALLEAVYLGLGLQLTVSRP